MELNHYTITGERVAAMNRGVVPFLLEVDAYTPEEAMEKCRHAFATWDVTSGEAVEVPPQLLDVQVTSDDPDGIQPCFETPPVPAASDVVAQPVDVPAPEVATTPVESTPVQTEPISATPAAAPVEPVSSAANP